MTRTSDRKSITDKKKQKKRPNAPASSIRVCCHLGMLLKKKDNPFQAQGHNDELSDMPLLRDIYNELKSYGVNVKLLKKMKQMKRIKE